MNDYVNNLDQLSHKRYLEKVTIINNIDPYNIKDWETDSDKLPAICYGDIVNYLVYGVSAYTLEEFRAYKSLEAFNQFACGWVKKIQTKQIGCYSVVLGQVMHSMRLSEKPLLPWIIASTDGVVKSAHCTCMAGLGEACSHVGALLFNIEDVVRKRNHLTVTDKLAYWGIPSFKNVQPEKVENINFSLPLKKRKIDSSATKENHVPPLSKDEFDGFLKTLKDAGCDAPILRVQKDYEVKKSTLPSKEDNSMLKSLKNNHAATMDFPQLLDYCKDLFLRKKIHITPERARQIKIETINQTKCKKWFEYRAGRVTASVMKAVCNSDAENPSLSLIKRMCYPNSYKFKTNATIWGCNHEETAYEMYCAKMQSHENFICMKSGLYINPDYPHIAATPDGRISCSCCAKGILEIKCPYCTKDCSIPELTKMKSCLKMDGAGNINLDEQHSYFYQVQTQIFVSKRDFCDLVVWTEKDIHIERIYPNEIFWEEIEDKATNFFIKALLPEIVAKWFTKQKKQ